jgi:pimeloyl-ACP methyl ester carboxylesterase
MNTTPMAEFGQIAVLVKVGEHKVGARIGGTGAPIILVHSLLADGSSFDPLARMLAATHRVVILDLPGFGNSDRVEGGLDAVADRLAAAIREFKYAQAPIFLGNGYGGFVALLTAIRHPDLAAKLVLADCGATFSEAGRAAFKGMSAGAAMDWPALPMWRCGVCFRWIFRPLIRRCWHGDASVFWKSIRRLFIRPAPLCRHSICAPIWPRSRCRC